MSPRCFAARHSVIVQACSGNRSASTLRVKVFRQEYAVARDHPAALGQPAVLRDVVGPRNAVAVEEQQVVARRPFGGAIACCTGAKAAVFLPDVLDGHRCRCTHRFDQGTCVIVGTVVSNNDLETAILLCDEPVEHRAQRVRPVIGRDDDRDHHHYCFRLGGSGGSLVSWRMRSVYLA